MEKKQPAPVVTVLSRPLYAGLALSIAVLFFAFNIYLPNLGLVVKSFGQYDAATYGTLLTSLFQGGLATLPIHAIINLIIISFLLGLVIALITYKVKTAKEQSLVGTKSATFGALFGLVAPACAACGLGLLSLLGLGSVLVYLPFRGTEVAILSIVLLGFATYHLNKSLGECNSCKVDLKKGKKRYG